MRLIFRGDTDPAMLSDVFEYRGYSLKRDGEPVYVSRSVAEEMLAMPKVQFQVVGTSQSEIIEAPPPQRRPSPIVVTKEVSGIEGKVEKRRR